MAFFNSINNRQISGVPYAYERCALLIVDFSKEQPYLFNNSTELKAAGIISEEFNIEYRNLNFKNFADDILKVYAQRYDLKNLMK
ncbi:hypothetical protein [uncultured Leptotrichia sp.]|uniref:hypothetical protein n=1 Tax=uncultured Leptotrichia sp. TaxID=159271 RepID=UPI002639CE93|nr:hypothetical protein [uncultured Leptotrichia sp.]